MQPLISVVIPCWGKYWNFIDKAVDSYITQTYRNTQLIIVSHKDNVVDAMNEGLKLSIGEYVLFLGSDDYLREDAIEKMLGLINPEIGFVWSGCQFFGNDNRVFLPRKINSVWDLLNPFYGHNCFGGQIGASLFNRDALEDVGGFKHTGHEDFDVCFRILLKGWKCKSVDEPIHFYFRRGKNLRDKNREKIFYKSYPIFRVLNFTNFIFRFIKRRLKFFGKA